MNGNFGLSEDDIRYIIRILDSHREIEKAVVFGSRAMGNCKKGSDVDIAITGHHIDFNLIARVHAQLEDESPMPYFFDIVDFKGLENQQLKQHIQKFGKEIFSRTTAD